MQVVWGRGGGAAGVYFSLEAARPRARAYPQLKLLHNDTNNN